MGIFQDYNLFFSCILGKNLYNNEHVAIKLVSHICKIVIVLIIWLIMNELILVIK